ncbi:MAG: hypothetical protein ACREJM_04570 [Candidatus Saccharimonadales bacterium]
MVGLPLFLTMMFCFAFVLVQAHQTDNVQSAANTSDSVQDKTSLGIHAKPKSKVSSPSHTSPSLMTSGSGNSPAAADPLSLSGGASPETTTPQPGGTPAKTLQSALPNNQPGNPVFKVVNQTSQTIYDTGNKLHKLVH